MLLAQPNINICVTKRSEKREYRALANEIKGNLKSLPDRTEKNSWLETMFVKTDRFLAKNYKIWVTGRIFVPVAFAALAVWAGLKSKSYMETIALGSLSVLILTIWHIVARTHRRFQNTHAAWLDAIEEIKEVHAYRLSIKSPTIETVRLWMILAMFLIWCYLSYTALHGTVSPVKQWHILVLTRDFIL